MLKDITVSLEELLEIGMQTKGIDFLPTKKINSVLSGRHTSKLRGRGMDFLELKPYVKGDDTRYIDWKATQRSHKTYVRVFSEERDRAVYLLVSQQSNMFFGTQGCFKSVQAARMAAAIFQSVLASGDRVGAVLFNDEEARHFKASKSKKLSTLFLEALATFNQDLLKR